MMNRCSSIRKLPLLNHKSQLTVNRQKELPNKLEMTSICSNMLVKLNNHSNSSRKSSQQSLKGSQQSLKNLRLTSPRQRSSPGPYRLKCKDVLRQSSAHMTKGSHIVIMARVDTINTTNIVGMNVSTSTLRTDIITIFSTLTIPCLTQTMTILTSSLVSTTTKILNITHHTT